MFAISAPNRKEDRSGDVHTGHGHVLARRPACLDESLDACGRYVNGWYGVYVVYLLFLRNACSNFYTILIYNIHLVCECECALNGITILQNNRNVINGGYNFKLDRNHIAFWGEKLTALLCSVFKSHHYTIFV